MKTKLLFIFFLFVIGNAEAQIVTLKKTKNLSGNNTPPVRANDSTLVIAPGALEPESTVETGTDSFKFLSGGNIDYLDGGLIQTNAQLLKVTIGNPNGFQMPFYICVGANAETTTNDEDPNKSTNANLLSPNGGYINMGFHGNLSPESWQSKEYSQFSFVYQLGVKTITGDDSLTDEKINMLSGIANIGVLYQTQAWNPEDPSILGMAYIQVAFANTFNNNEKIKKIYGEDINKHFYGVNVEAGIEITNYINLRLGYYKYFNNEDVNEDFKNGIFKISLDFVN